MTSATLYREGTDLDALLADLDQAYPGQVRVVEVSYPRSGGVFGFFAKQRVAVEYRLDERPRPRPAPALEPSRRSADSPAAALDRFRRSADSPVAGDPLAELIAAAEAAESYGGLRVSRPLAAPAALVAATTGGFELSRRGAATTSGAAASGGAATAEMVRSRFSLASRAGVEDELVRAAPSNAEFAKLLLAMAAQKSTAKPVERPGPALVERIASRDVVEWAARPATAEATAAAALLESAARSRVDVFAVAAPAPAEPALSAREPAEPALAAPEPTLSAPELALSARERPATLGPIESDSPLTLRRKLAELGVPLERIPGNPLHTYAAVEQLVARLPKPANLPTKPGEIAVIVGPARHILTVAEQMIATMRVRPANVWGVDCPADSVAGTNRINDAWQAATVAAEIRLVAPGPALVVVCTDGEGESSRTGELIGAFRPEALWAHVDATRKPSDTRWMLTELGTPTALVVTGAARTCSPASVWGLGIATSTLDGRPATGAAWAVLLLDKINELRA